MSSFTSRSAQPAPIQPSFRFAVFILGLLAALTLSALSASAAYYPNMSYGPKQGVAPGVTWQTATHANPRWSIQIIEINMANPNIAVRPVFKSTGNTGANQRTSTLASRAEAIAAINAGYFASNLMTNSYTLINGQFIGGSAANMQPENNRSVLGFSAPPQTIAKRTKLSRSFVPADPTNWDQITDAIAGRGHFVTANGVLITQDNESTTTAHHASRHPRTAIGYSLNPYRVWFVTVDGRQSNFSVGMTYTELGRLMADLGIEQSISLDGGGSTTAWIRGRGVVNRPSNTNNSERTVVSAWAVVELSYSSRFSETDWVSTTATANLNLRSGPGTSFPVISSFPFGTTAVIRPDPANGIRTDGHNWWFVKLYPNGPEGWWTETYLTSTESPALPVLRISQGSGEETVKLSWQSEAGITYRIERSDDLKIWSPLGTPVPGNGSEISMETPAIPQTRNFYRLTIVF